MTAARRMVRLTERTRAYVHCTLVRDREDGAPPAARPPRRVCLRRGCDNPVNKSTAKYCSVRCCSVDPERRARLRESAQRSGRQVLPMTRQLSLAFNAQANPEAIIARLCAGREDIPQGMSRLSG